MLGVGLGSATPSRGAPQGTFFQGPCVRPCWFFSADPQNHWFSGRGQPARYFLGHRPTERYSQYHPPPDITRQQAVRWPPKKDLFGPLALVSLRCGALPVMRADFPARVSPPQTRDGSARSVPNRRCNRPRPSLATIPAVLFLGGNLPPSCQLGSQRKPP